MAKHILFPPSTCLLAVLVVCGSTLGNVAETTANHIVVPHCRSYGFSTSSEPAIRIVKVRAQVEIAPDLRADTTLTIELENMSAEDQRLELYAPVPDGVVVQGIRLGQEAVPIEAEVLTPGEAADITEQLVLQVNDPSLMEFLGASFVRSTPFSMGPHAQSSILLTYRQTLKDRDHLVDYTLPRTESLQYQVPWETSVVIRSNQAVGGVYSPSHKLDVRRSSATEVYATNRSEYGTVSGPFQLYYLLETQGLAVSTLAFPADHYDGGYFLLIASVPSRLAGNDATIKREITLVLDRSGSMKGVKIEQVKEAASQVISGLEDGEAFNLITYASDVTHFSDRPLLKDALSADAALSFIRPIEAKGSTNLHGALQEALLQPPMEGMLPLILFLTDGLPTSGEKSEVKIRDLVISSNPYNRRVFTLGVGYDLNAPLLDALAEHSLARSIFVTPEDNVGNAIRDVFGQVSRPILTDAWIYTPAAEGSELPSRTYNVLPFLLPDMFQGDQLVLLGQYVGQDPFTIEMGGNYLNRQQSFVFPFDPNTADIRKGFIPRLWAARVVAAIIDELRELGADPNFQRSDDRLFDLAVAMVDFSLKYGVLTEYTSFFGSGAVDLLNYGDLLYFGWLDLFDRAVSVRTGKGAVNQSINLDLLRSQSILNRDNLYLDKDMQEVKTTTLQQFNDLAFYYRDGQWIESTLLLPSDSNDTVGRADIEFGSQAYIDLADRLTRQGRQGSLSLAADVVLWESNTLTFVDMPDSIVIPPWSNTSEPNQTTQERSRRTRR